MLSFFWRRCQFTQRGIVHHHQLNRVSPRPNLLGQRLEFLGLCVACWVKDVVSLNVGYIQSYILCNPRQLLEASTLTWTTAWIHAVMQRLVDRIGQLITPPEPQYTLAPDQVLSLHPTLVSFLNRTHWLLDVYLLKALSRLFPFLV